MSFAPDDLGELGTLATALGLVDGAGNFRDGWLSRPGDYLGSVLADDTQRDALIAFVDDVLGGAERRRDARGRIWLPMVAADDPPITFSAVVDEAPPDHVRIGLGVTIVTTAPASSTSLHLPLFRAAKSGHAAGDPLLLGRPGGAIGFATEITIDPAPPAPGAAHLGKVGLTLEVPTDPADGAPDIALFLGTLQLPGASQPRDLTIALGALDELDDAALDLVLGLLQAQADALGSGPVAAIAGLLGLRSGGAVPALPVAALASQGPAALAAWFETVMASAATRGAWLGELATLLGGGAAVVGDTIELEFGPAQVALGVRVETGAGGRSVVTPMLTAAITDGSLRARAEADLARIDLATSSAAALPRLALVAHAGRTAAGGAPLLTGDPAVEALRLGLALDATRRPVVVLAADNVTIGTNSYPTLDLSTPHAVAESLGTVLGDVIDDLIGQLGPVGEALRVLLGLAAPTGDPAVPTVDFGEFLRNPLAAVAGHWRRLLRDHAGAVPELLASLRTLVADAAAGAVAGSGTEADPWRVPLVGPVELHARAEAAGDRLIVALACRYAVDTLGQRCTRVETRLVVTLAALDLAGGAVVFAGGIEARLTARARGDTRARFGVGPVALSADHVGLRALWRPEAGIAVDVLAPNLAAEIDDEPIPVALPAFTADGLPDLDAAGWNALERLLGLLAAHSPVPAFAELASALGWIPEGPLLFVDPAEDERPHLRLAELVADPQQALLAWAQALLLERSGPVEDALNVLARLLTGTATALGSLRGEGRPDAPYLLALFDDGATPELAFWLEPHGPVRPTLTEVPDELRDWQPGDEGFDGNLLAEALLAESALSSALGDLVAQRGGLADGLEALVTRWSGTDGRVVPPATDPVGVTVHRLDDVSFAGLAERVDPAALLGAAPATLVHVAVVAADAPLPWAAAPPERIVDLRAPGLAPEAFQAPVAATGEWFVALAGRAAARLAAGDPDGTEGQAGRLQRILAPFAGLGGGLALVAGGAAGHAARLAAERVAAVSAVITLGTPLGPVAFAVLDTPPAAELLRLLRWLLPPADPAAPDDPDLALGRALVTALTDLLPLGDPGVELRPPANPLPEPRAGLASHAAFGTVGEAAVRRALSAIVLGGLSERADLRASAHASEPITGASFAVRLPFALIGDGLRVSGQALLEVLKVDLAQPGGPSLSAARAVVIEFIVARETGWLLGGPDPARGPGPRPDHELRRLEATIVLPLAGDVQALAELTLIEPRVFGIERERWIVRPGAAAAAAAEIVTPALPEVRALLAQVAPQLSATSAPALGALREILEGLALFDAAGGLVPDALDHLLHEPAAHVADALAEGARRALLTDGLRTLLGDVSGLDVDLAARRLTLDLAGLPGTIGLVPWRLHLELDASGPPRFELSLGSAGTTAAGGVVLRARAQPLALTLERHLAGANSAQVLPLWPAPDAAALARMVAQISLAELGRIGLAYLRNLDEDARPIIDAALDAIGLLGPAAADLPRPVLLPLGLLEDPAGWFGHTSALGAAAGFDPARVINLLDAFKPILGVAGGPGEWVLGSGFSLRAETAAGAPRLGLHLDTAVLTPVPGAPGRLLLGGTFALELPAGRAARPALALAVGLAGAAPGRRALHLLLGDRLELFLRPDTGPDLPLFPDPPGLGQLAQAAVTQALPLVLDALAAETGAGLAADVGAVVRAVGDTLALRTGTPARFDGAALQAWASDPASAFASRLPALSATALTGLASAIDPLLPAAAAASAAGGELTVAAGDAAIRLRPSPFELGVAASLTGVPGAERLELALTLDGAGLRSLVVTAGPAAIDAGGASLRPYFQAAVGAAPPDGRRVLLGLAHDAAGSSAAAARWLLDGGGFALVAVDGGVEHIEPEAVALALLGAVLDLVAGFTFATPAVTELLDKPLPGAAAASVREVLRGVFLEDVPTPAALDANLFDPALLLGRLQRLLTNLAGTGPSIAIGGGLTVGLGTSGPGNTIVELALGITGRVNLTQGDVVVALEADSRWISGAPPAGLTLGLIDTAGGIAFAPRLGVNGVGVRIGRASRPLIDAGVTLGSAALHLFGAVGAGELAGGVQLQLSELAVGVGGTQGGNPVAQGLVADAGSGPDRLAPAFSPALAVQKHGAGPVLVSLRAGEGDGPWWLVIQKGFGPIYIEQVGFGVTLRQDQLERIALLLDGRVSIAGLTAAVDDLQLSFLVTSNASPFDPSRWSVDLAGLAVEADMAGVTLAGGLRKFGSGASVEYIGMLLARFATYGLSVYGGYGTGIEDGQKFSAFFAFGAINGPIGGPPAFFLTGIGGGVGINRNLIFPTELARFGEFPFIKALDPGARPSGDPMAELVTLRSTFPMRRGEFWFAAGISFTSFALVDGVAVVAVKVGDGLELSLLGLGRVALPRPQVALVSIELGLIARFSTREGVLWVQAQLTDNSWLLHESVRLTGGYAFVSWFAGPNRGQFVLTMGGYHPRFRRDGYPVVPRLGFRWQVGSAIVIKGENYFALTSEALMAGGRLEASAKFGPAWAHVVFGADGIVYFDPFQLEVEAYARISAGVTIDVWIGEITISISIGARILVIGPKFRGRATFEVGPVGLTVAFGDQQPFPKKFLSWSEFVAKYLEEARPGVARAVSALPGKGALSPGTGPGGATETGTADGSAARPFEVLSEFELTVTTTVPTRLLRIGTTDSSHAPSRDLGLAPLNQSSVQTRLVVRLLDAGNVDRIGGLSRQVLRSDGFPIGVWGNPQPDDDRKVPSGDVIGAVEGVRLEARAQLQGTLPREMAYHQVESGPRKPLPFVHERGGRAVLVQDAGRVADVLPAATAPAAVYAAAKPWLALGGQGSTALAALERERAAPPRLGSLTEGLAAAEPPAPAIDLPDAPTPPTVDTSVHPPVWVAVLSSEVAAELPTPRTTVREPGAAVRVAPPTLASIQAAADPALAARLLQVPAPGGAGEKTLIARGAVPLTRVARSPVAAVGGRGAAMAGRERLATLSRGLTGGRGVPAATLAPGEIAVLTLPNAERDLEDAAPRPGLAAKGGPARVVALTPGGQALGDTVLSNGGFAVPQGTERLAVVALGERTDPAPGILGWYASQPLPYVGWSTALAPGAILCAEAARVRRSRQRFRAGWVAAAELIADAPIVTTRFRDLVRSVGIVLDDRVDAARGRNLSLRLDGAERATDRAGRVLPPTLVASGNRSVLVYAIRPTTDAGPVTVTITRQEDWRLAGVIAAQQDPGALIPRLGEAGLDRLLQPLAPGHGGDVTLRWTAAQPPPRAPRRAPAPRRRPRSRP